MRDIHIIEIEDVTIASVPIISSGHSRREAERDAVDRMVAEVIGKEVYVLHHDDGAPYIPGGRHISITHCRDIAAIAISLDTPVGIDAEQWRPALRRVARKFLSDSEMEIFTTDDDLLRAWTVKEAVYKIAGGAALDFRHNIAIAPGFSTATSLGSTYRLHTFTIADATVTVARII